MEIDYGFLIQKILEVVITVLLPILLTAVVRGINAFVDSKRASREFDQFETAVSVVRQLVLAAEQLGLIGVIEDIGRAKKQYVIDMAEKELARRGIYLDIDVLDALVEAQVKEAINDLKPIVVPENAPAQPKE